MPDYDQILPGAVYTRTCAQRCCVVGIREPRKSDDIMFRLTDLELDQRGYIPSLVGRKITSMDVGVVSIR